MQQRLAALSLVNLDKIPTDRVAYGSRVSCTTMRHEKEIEYTLVSPEESDVSQGLISITSPIGRSLVGKMEGDSVEIVTPSGKKRIRNPRADDHPRYRGIKPQYSSRFTSATLQRRATGSASSDGKLSTCENERAHQRILDDSYPWLPDDLALLT